MKKEIELEKAISRYSIWIIVFGIMSLKHILYFELSIYTIATFIGFFISLYNVSLNRIKLDKLKSK